MSVPVQVWSSFIECSPMDEVWVRDLQRAQTSWQGEVRVWLHPLKMQPDVNGIVRWHTMQEGVRLEECLVPSEHLNCLSIFHVDEARRIYPLLGTPQAHLKVLPEGLYARWVNTKPAMIEAPRDFTWVLPRVVAGQVKMDPAKVRTLPGAVLPAAESSTADDFVRLQLRWPPPGARLPSTISPETESRTMYGRLRRKRTTVGGGDVDTIETEYDPQMAALPLWLKWSGPFDAMFPLGGGFDLLAHQAMMHWCIEHLAGNERPVALRTIESWVQRLGGEAESTLEQAWLMPRLMVDIGAALLDVEGRFGLSATTLDALASLPTYSEVLTKRVTMRRVHGWLGYFWWELSEDVRTNMAVRFCEHCGQIIRGGHADRQFCSRAESPVCFRERHATVQRRARATQKGREGEGALRRRRERK